MKDIIIVGSGIAACTLAWQLHSLNKSFVIITDRKKGSSNVAAGVYNPMVLKRFTAVWKAQEQLDAMNDLYDYVYSITGVDYRNTITVARRFHDDKEASTWVKKSHRDDLKNFMHHEVTPLHIKGIDAVSGYGLVNGTGWVDTTAFMEATLSYFEAANAMVLETFDHNNFKRSNNQVEYKNVKASNIIFSEGYRMIDNPYFKQLPLQGNKGEILIVKIPNLKLDHIIKSSVFLMPYKDDLFWVGATYDRDDLNDQPSVIGREFLTSRLERFLNLPYEVIKHKSGIRPTTIDRRPFVGHHPDHKNLSIFNGMGSRAVLIAPWAAQQLIDNVFVNAPLNTELDIQRFN